jgi:hypothetical protein
MELFELLTESFDLLLVNVLAVPGYLLEQQLRVEVL